MLGQKIDSGGSANIKITDKGTIIMGKYFGTDGFRGEANVVLTVEHAFKVGRYLGWYFGQDHKARIVIGKDTRRSSYMFEYALAAGLTASGADACSDPVSVRTVSKANVSPIGKFISFFKARMAFSNRFF